MIVREFKVKAGSENDFAAPEVRNELAQGVSPGKACKMDEPRRGGTF